MIDHRRLQRTLFRMHADDTFARAVLDDESRRKLATGQLDQFRAHMRRRKMLYLQESALLKVVEGLTSIGEVTRALAPKADTKNKSG